MNLNNNQYKNIKPYRARNMIIKNLEVRPVLPPTAEVGYINTSVSTASGALPVPNAIVTVSHIYNNSEEHVLYHLITDESGRVPTMEVPVEYQGVGQQTEFYYSIYNMRIEANGYYTVNILDVQVHPNISTDYRVNLIPVAQGITEIPEHTIVIPKIPAESSNQ